MRRIPMRKVRLKPNTDATIRYNAAIKYLGSVFDEYEAEVAAVDASPKCEAQRRKSQLAYRKLIEALLLYAHEIAKLRHQRPN
jgi:hypothetical protein